VPGLGLVDQLWWALTPNQLYGIPRNCQRMSLDGMLITREDRIPANDECLMNTKAYGMSVFLVLCVSQPARLPVVMPWSGGI
jgi:hypothetical protein